MNCLQDQPQSNEFPSAKPLLPSCCGKCGKNEGMGLKCDYLCPHLEQKVIKWKNCNLLERTGWIVMRGISNDLRWITLLWLLKLLEAASSWYDQDFANNVVLCLYFIQALLLITEVLNRISKRKKNQKEEFYALSLYLLTIQMF